MNYPELIAKHALANNVDPKLAISKMAAHCFQPPASWQ